MDMLAALNTSVTGFVVVLIVLALLACIIVVLSKVIRFAEGTAKKAAGKEKAVAPAKASEAVTAPAAAPVYGTELYRVSEKSAATIMAITSHETGIPLNKLAFKSIKLAEDLKLVNVDDKTAAVVMALVSHQSGIPLNRLVFKSIKLIEK